jgi:hypothetical protein
MHAHTIFLLLDFVKSKALPGGTEVNIMLSIVRGNQGTFTTFT